MFVAHFRKNENVKDNFFFLKKLRERQNLKLILNDSSKRKKLILNENLVLVTSRKYY